MVQTKADRQSRTSPWAKKLWAVACVVGFTGAWTYGFIALSGLLGDRPTHPMTFVLCFAGLALGIVGWRKVMSFAPKFHGKRAAARARLEAEYEESRRQGTQAG